MKILSLFDGMACGMIAMQAAGVDVESYDAYEIDKYAITAATHNFPVIQEHGDVFAADFTQYAGVDFLVGGSPCTHWSIAQTKNRETTVSRDEKGQVLLHSSGIGFELFSQYLRALEEAKPKFFIYENNWSMSKDIRAAITECFGFEPIMINSALVSAQSRKRLYWVGKRNADGAYSKVNVGQPEDRGILLKDVLDSAVANQLSEREMDYMVRDSKGGYSDRGSYLQKPCDADKALCITANISKGVPYNVVAEPVNAAADVFDSETVKAAADDIVDKKGYLPEMWNPYNRAEITDKSPTLSTGSMATSSCATILAEPIGIKHLGSFYGQQTRWGVYDEEGKAPTLTASAGMGGGHIPMVKEPLTDICQVGAMPMPNGELSTSAGFRVYSTDAKGRYLCANGGGAGAKTGLYAEPIQGRAIDYEPLHDCDVVVTANNIRCSRQDRTGTAMGYTVYFTDVQSPTVTSGHAHKMKIIEQATGKEMPVYEVRDGMITIKGKQYPIKLRDGYYIIRKLTVSECKRLQTVPEWYDFSCVSNSQAYKMLGNGWTCEVITHLIRACLSSSDEKTEGWGE